jgi:hypothetical protein
MAKSESIIEIIQRMVQEGQPREKIIQTLRDLGVNQDQANRLLLIAEADTLTLLKNEINSMVKKEFMDQRKDFEDLIHNDLKLIESEEKVTAGNIAREELKDVKNNIVTESRSFEDRVNKVIMESQKTVSLVKVALDSLNTRIAQMELDVEQMKVHKFRKKSMFISYAALAFGGAILFSALFLLWANMGSLDLAQVVMIFVLLLVSIVMMFASIIG